MSRMLDAERAAALDSARELVAAIAAQDWPRLRESLADDVDFHAVVPGTGSFREQYGADETVAQIRKWFGDSDPLELLLSVIEPIVDRVHITYRLAACEEGSWHLVEQHAYARIEKGRIAKLDLVCSGFRSVAERPAASISRGSWAPVSLAVDRR
jgi:hypothetical protein